MSTVQGEDVYGAVQDDINDIRNAADKTYRAGKNIYDTGEKIHDFAANRDHNHGENKDAASGQPAPENGNTTSGNTPGAAENLYGAEDAAGGGAASGGAVNGAAGGTAGAAGGAAEAGEAAAGGAGAEAAGGAAAAGGSAAAAGGAAEAAGGATGAAAGGAAAAVGAEAGAGMAAGGWVVVVAIAVILALFFFVTLFTTMQEEGQGSAGVRYTSSQYSQIRGNYSGKFEEGNNDDRPEDDPDYNELQSHQGTSHYLKAYCQFIPFMKGTEKFVSDIKGDELLEGTVKEMSDEKGFANTVGVFEKAKKLAMLDGKDWIKELERTNPLGDWDNELSSEITMGKLNAAVNGLFKDIDYAELIDVLSQNGEFDLTNMTEKDFRKVFLGNRSNRTDILRKYYYLHIEPRKSTYGAEGVATKIYDDFGNLTYDNSNEPLDVGDVTLEKYNLDELYTICSGPNAEWGVNPDFNPDSTDIKSKVMTNAKKLNWMETRTRRYGGFNITSGTWNTDTPNKLFGNWIRSGRGEIRERRSFDHADFKYWVSETLDDLFSALHGLFQHGGSSTTGGGYIENKKNKKILDMYRYINQGENPQASLSFAGGTFQQYGCAPSSYIMVIEYFLRQQVDIESAIKKYSAGSQGIYGNAMINAYGGTSSQSSYGGPEQIISQIDAGKPVILSLRGQNSFHHTNGGHYLVIMGYDEEGFYMYDPGSRENTYGYGTQNCTVTYEQFAKDAGTFQGIYTFNFANVTIPEFSENTTGGTTVTFDVDNETVAKVESALSMNFATGAKAYAMEYALLTQKYGSNFAIGFMANMCQESGGTGGLDQKTKKVFTSGADIQAYMNANVSWSGLGIHQWTASRKQGLLNQYQEDGLLSKSSVTQEDLIASELNYLMKELNGSESGVIAKCEGKSASECATIIAKEFERCGIDGGRANNAKSMYNALQRNGVLE